MTLRTLPRISQVFRPIPAAQFMGTFTDPNYYDKTYHFTNTPDYEKVRAFAIASGLITPQGINSGNYNLIERVSAGYLMNTIDLNSRFRLVAGVRFEATHVATRSFNMGRMRAATRSRSPSTSPAAATTWMFCPAFPCALA